MMLEEKEVFVPYIAAYLGKSVEEVEQLQAKLDMFAPTAKVIQWYSSEYVSFRSKYIIYIFRAHQSYRMRL